MRIAGRKADTALLSWTAEKVIKGWDIGVATMARGEVARFIIAPEYAYGAKGFAPKVEPDETLDFEIELLRFKVRDGAPSGVLTLRG